MSKKQITLLFNAPDFFGTINPMINLAKVIKSRGHRIVFVSNEWFRQTVENCGFIYEAKLEISSESNNPESVNEFILSTGLLSAKSSTESIKIFTEFKIIANALIRSRKCEQNIIKKCIEKYLQDILVTNSLLGSAESVYSGIPWVGIYCESPLNLYDSNLLPPYMSGFATNSYPNDWKEFQILNKLHEHSLINEINQYYREYGFPVIKTSYAISPYLNIYSYPKELDYCDKVSAPANWYRVDSLFTDQSDGGEFKIPEQLANKSGKLIYVSLGTMGSVNLELLKKLVAILSKSAHRFIVSKGQRSAEYELFVNMWGDSYLPQTLILPKVDLFITHGGNNSCAEGFYFGKPMIVMPIFIDQFDNAQRIHETGFGIRIDTQQFTECDLLSAIETLLSDTQLHAKLTKAAQRIHEEKSLEKAVLMIENLITYE